MIRFSPHSIFFKTTLIFGLLLVLLSAGAWVLRGIEERRSYEEVLHHLKPVLFSFRKQARSRLETDVILEQISQFGFEKVTRERAAEVLENGVSFRDILKKRSGKPRDAHGDRPRDPPHSRLPEFPDDDRASPLPLHDHFFELMELDGEFFLILSGGDEVRMSKPDGKEVVYQYQNKREKLPIGLMFVVMVCLVSVVYYSILRSLIPAQNLLKGIHRFSKGESGVNLRSDRKDEIAEIANAFDQALQHVHELTESRRLFVRNIMHELKTPIASGKLALGMVEDSKYKERLEQIFEREEHLLDEFFRIESIASGKLELKRAEYNLVDVVDAATDLLFDRSELVEAEVKESPEVPVDFSLFSIALKNLLDNGIRYSEDHSVRLILEHTSVRIENIGKPMSYPLEHYAIPYMLKGEKEKESRGFGFGLYITWHICRLHGFDFSYRYDETRKNSVFTVKFA